MRRQLQLNEWKPAEVKLSAAEALELQGGPGDIAVERIGPGVWRVTPSQWVGSIALENTDVLVRPKVGVERLFYLLGYARKLGFGERIVPLAEEPDVTEALVRAFLEQTERALRRGPLMSYRQIDEAIPSIRGRVRFADQTRRRFLIPLPVEVSYDEFTVDTEENRLLKAALRRAERLRLRERTLRGRIRATLIALDAVEEVRYDARSLPAFNLTRLNRHYGPALDLGKVLLSAATTDLEPGAARTPTFLIDMNKVFEDFVFRALEDRLAGAGRWRQGRPIYLDAGGKVRMYPDLSLWRGRECLFVGDVKYKQTLTGENDDLYQLLSYIRALGLEEGMLIYAEADEAVPEHVVRKDGSRLRIRRVDLQANEDELGVQLDALTNEIRVAASVVEEFAA